MQRPLTRLAIALTLSVVVACLLLAALGFLGASLYLVLARTLSPPLSALLTAVAALVLAGVVILVYRASRPPPRATAKPLAGLAGSQLGIAGALGERVGQDLSAFARANAKQATVAALLFGFAVGVSPRLRRAIRRALQ